MKTELEATKKEITDLKTKSVNLPTRETQVDKNFDGEEENVAKAMSIEDSLRKKYGGQ